MTVFQGIIGSPVTTEFQAPTWLEFVNVLQTFVLEYNYDPARKWIQGFWVPGPSL